MRVDYLLLLVLRSNLNNVLHLYIYRLLLLLLTGFNLLVLYLRLPLAEHVLQLLLLDLVRLLVVRGRCQSPHLFHLLLIPTNVGLVKVPPLHELNQLLAALSLCTLLIPRVRSQQGLQGVCIRTKVKGRVRFGLVSTPSEDVRVIVVRADQRKLIQLVPF